MRVILFGEYQPVLTFFLHLIIIDWIWKFLEVNYLGETNGNIPDSIILIFVCGYITWLLR